jgi:OmpA-OmpF porin, OOP family
MKAYVHRILVACLLVGWCVPFVAAQCQDYEGEKDHPLISRYPESCITDYKTTEFDEFTLPLGKLDSNGAPVKSQHLEGKITFIKYETPTGRSELEVFRNYESALKTAGFEILFSCAHPDGCGHGDPTLWQANGTEAWEDDNMRALSAKLARPAGDVYVSLLVSEYGAHYVRLYVVEVKPMQTGMITVNAASLANDINRTGHASVYGIYFDTGKADVKPESDATLGEISNLLQQDAKLKLYVVGHTDNVGTLAVNMDLSKRRGDAVVKVLTTQYHIAAARLSAQGDGPTAPVASNKTEEGRAKNRRVELVEQ